MRTTISLNSEVLAAAKSRARQRGVSLGQVIEEALQRFFTRESRLERPAIPVFKGGTGVRPGIDLTSNRALLEVLDETKDLDSLR